MKIEIEKVAENIYKITERYFLEHANVFVFCGEDFNIVIDCGLGFENIKEFLVGNGFKNLKVFITHAHFDHCGAIKFFNPDELLIKEKVSKNIEDRELLGLDYLKPNDFVEDIKNIDEICKSFDIKKDPSQKTFYPSTLSNTNFEFEVISAPGHTDDSYILFDRDNKILVTGDALYDGEIYASMKNSDKQDFIRTLNSIGDLDFNIVYPGHNQIMDKQRALEIIDLWVQTLKQD